MELAIINADGSSDSSVQLSESLTSAEFNEGLVHQLVVAYLANARGDTVGHKSRATVIGTGRKPWAQKGQGRARAGTVKSPLWRGGGKTFVSDERHHQQKVNRKMHRAGMRGIFSELIRQDRLKVVDVLKPTTHKTAQLISQLGAWGVGTDNVLLVDLEFDADLSLAVRNIPKVDNCTISELSAVDLVGFDRIIVSAPALKGLEVMYQ